MKVWRSVAVCCLLLLVLAWRGEAAEPYYYTLDNNDNVLPVHYGHNGSDVFLAAPYADPSKMGPTGDQDPEPIDDTNWAEYIKLRAAEIPGSARFGYFCPQQQPQPGAPYESYYRMKANVTCLSLNVFSPLRTLDPTDETYPVLVLFHGGRLVSGSAADFGMRGLMKRFVKKKFVVVTVSYRVGNEGASDRALLDMTEALEFIQNYIGRFQGDPKRVTLYSYEYGGCMASYLTQLAMVDTNYEHLFGNVIIQSGWSRMCANGSAFPTWSNDNSAGVVTVRRFPSLPVLAERIERAIAQGRIGKTKRKILFITGINEGAVYETLMKSAFNLSNDYYTVAAEQIFQKMYPGYNKDAKKKDAIDAIIRYYKFSEAALSEEFHKRWLHFIDDVVTKSGIIRDTSLLAVQHDAYIAIVNYTGSTAIELGQSVTNQEVKLALEGNFTSAQTVFALTFLPEHSWSAFNTMEKAQTLTREMQLSVFISNMINDVGQDRDLAKLGWVKQTEGLPSEDPKFLDSGSDDDGLLLGDSYVDWNVLFKFAALNPVKEPFQGEIDTEESTPMVITAPAPLDDKIEATAPIDDGIDATAPLDDEIDATAVLVMDEGETLLTTDGLGHNGTF